MKHNVLRLAIAQLLLVPMLLLLACAAPSLPPSPVVVAPPAIPALPLSARQVPRPEFCSPTCSDRLRSDYARWRQVLTSPAGQASPASEPMTP